MIADPVRVVDENMRDVPRDGATPGDALPVFDCDFGKLGLQICYDMEFEDGWTELARKGAVRVRRSAGQAAVHAHVQPLVCLPGRQFSPRTTTRGVRVIPWGRIVTEIVDRRRTVTPHQAHRFAEALGALHREPTPVG